MRTLRGGPGARGSVVLWVVAGCPAGVPPPAWIPLPTLTSAWPGSKLREQHRAPSHTESPGHPGCLHVGSILMLILDVGQPCSGRPMAVVGSTLVGLDPRGPSCSVFLAWSSSAPTRGDCEGSRVLLSHGRSSPGEPGGWTTSADVTTRQECSRPLRLGTFCSRPVCSSPACLLPAKHLPHILL